MLALGAAALLAVAVVPAPAAGSSHPAPPPGAVPGMIAVADSGNNRIQVFYPNGTFAFMFGHPHSPSSIAVGPVDGRIVVGDSNCCADSTARVFGPDGSHAFNFRTGVGGLGIVYTPNGVAVGPDGQIVVAEDQRIQVFNHDGSFALAFGSRTGEDRLVYVADVAVGPDGQIVVVDGGADLVRVFGPDGSPVSDLPVPGAHIDSNVAVGPDGQIAVFHGGLRIYHPVLHPNGTVSYEAPVFVDFHGFGDVAFGPNGRIVVADPSNHRVQVYHPANATGSSVRHPNGSLVPAGSFAFGFGSFGSVLSGFDSPTDVAVGPDGRIVVAEPGNYRIRVFHPNGTAAFEFGSHGSGDGHFYIPHQVAVGPDGRIVVGDRGKSRVQVFNPDGSPALAFGSHGRGEREFWQVHDVAVGPDGRIIVADTDNHRIQVFNPDGSLALTIPVDTVFYVAVGPDGRIASSGATGFQVFNPDGTSIYAYSEGPKPLAVGPDGRIVSIAGNFITVMNPNGSLAFASPIEVYANGVAVGPDGRIVVLDNIVDDRVHVFNSDGTYGFALLPDLSGGRFDHPISVAVGPLVPPPAPSLAPANLPVVLGPSAGGLRNFTAAGDAANLTIDVAGLAGPGGRPLNGSGPITVVFPPSETVVAASFAEVSFPPGVTASHVPADGLLALRVVADGPTAERAQAALGRNGSEIVLLQRVVEVGAEGSHVVFDMPVRILLEEQAGGRAFWVEGAGANGTITPIDEECDAASDAAAVHSQLGGSGECQVDEPGGGGGKIVYTYHLTRFGTVSSAGPAPQPVFAGGLGAGGAGANGTAPPVAPPVPVPAPIVHTCSVSLGSANLDLRATAGGYSDPVRQALRNTGSLALEHVELGATAWKDVGPLQAPASAPSLPPPVVGTDAGRTSSVLAAVLVAGLPASTTELSTDARGAVPYAPLANGTAVAHDLEGGAEEPIWFRMNLSDRGGLQGGTFVQTITYQAQCAPP